MTTRRVFLRDLEVPILFTLSSRRDWSRIRPSARSLAALGAKLPEDSRKLTQDGGGGKSGDNERSRCLASTPCHRDTREDTKGKAKVTPRFGEITKKLQIVEHNLSCPMRLPYLRRQSPADNATTSLCTLRGGGGYRYH